MRPRPTGFVHDDKSLCSECNCYGMQPHHHQSWCSEFGPDTSSAETDRWWQAFCAKLASWTSPSNRPHAEVVENCALVADAAIAEAGRRGRL